MAVQRGALDAQLLPARSSLRATRRSGESAGTIRTPGRALARRRHGTCLGRGSRTEGRNTVITPRGFAPRHASAEASAMSAVALAKAELPDTRSRALVRLTARFETTSIKVVAEGVNMCDQDHFED